MQIIVVIKLSEFFRVYNLLELPQTLDTNNDDENF